MNNLEIWDSLSKPPVEALKAISGGRLRGKTDINPQWRMKAITEKFGPCGFGWKYEIVRLWREDTSGGESCAFAQINVYIKQDSSWSDPIPGIGGSMLISKESSGLYNSDEAYKMATTDALSVALKAIGVAAEIYLGNFDGTKYVDRSKNKIDQLKQSLTDYINGGYFEHPENVQKVMDANDITQMRKALLAAQKKDPRR